MAEACERLYKHMDKAAEIVKQCAEDPTLLNLSVSANSCIMMFPSIFCKPVTKSNTKCHNSAGFGKYQITVYLQQKNTCIRNSIVSS